jgi:hypothetical protein
MERREALKNSILAGTWFSLAPVSKLLGKNQDEIDNKYLKCSLNPSYPQFNYLSVDSLGKGKLDNNPLLLDKDNSNDFFLNSNSDSKSTKYFTINNQDVTAWEFEVTKQGFILRSHYVENNVSWVIKINQIKNHVTALGIMSEKNKIKTPFLLHFPDMGSFQIKSKQVKVIDYISSRDVPVKFVQVSFPPATKEKQFIEYFFNIVAIYPAIKGIEKDSIFDGYRRNYMNTFQVNPNCLLLSNNSSSDPVAFTQYGYSEVALSAPKIVDGLRVMDIVKMTIDRFLSGAKGYGMVGYKNHPSSMWGGQSASLDTYPSLLIAACNYYISKNDDAWLKEKYDGLVTWAEEIISRDKDGDGIIEYGFSGNTGSWTGDGTMRPANWWDTIGFGHKDAYSNCLAYRALLKFIKLCKRMEDEYRIKRYAKFAEKLRRNYFNTFINKETGVLAGWKSEDGKLHDYYFTFVNSIAITYELVTNEQGNKIMDALLAKMKEAGFNNFELGLPGNLIPVKREDYTHHDPRWGGNTTDELNDGWQHYENGGTSGNFVYFTLNALFKLDRKIDVNRILFPLLKGFEEGNFQGMCDNGMTKDWRGWDGECWGYEGFLVDNYWGLLAVAEGYK